MPVDAATNHRMKQIRSSMRRVAFLAVGHLAKCLEFRLQATCVNTELQIPMPAAHYFRTITFTMDLILAS